MLREVLMVVHCVEGGWVVDAERWMSVLTMEAFLVAIHPAAMSTSSWRPVEETYIVFQLNLPSYLMLRRCGSLVKSTVSTNGFKSGKKSSKDGASSDMVENRRPVSVIWVLSSSPYYSLDGCSCWLQLPTVLSLKTLTSRNSSDIRQAAIGTWATS